MNGTRNDPADPSRSLLFTDLYQLTMAQAYHVEGMRDTAVFELFFRTMPRERNYIVAAGLGDCLAFLEEFRVTDADREYLRSFGLFADDFIKVLGGARFTGDVDAVPEGTIVFANEPLLRVTAPIMEAQLVETMLLNQVNFQSLAASKAARVVTAAAGRTVVDFGSRRAHGTDAAMKAARTSYLAGAAGTSNVLAGRVYGIPVFGTMAHSYIQAHDDEAAAFEQFTRLYPETTLLVDTYDTLAGVQKVIDLGRRLGDAFRLHAVRLDSGDLAQLAKQTRRMFDEAGLQRVQIFASSEFDEHKITKLIADGAPIDGFGVGTHLAIASGAPDIDMAYKLVEYAARPRVKLSSHKVLYPGRKQVFRVIENGKMVGDIIARMDEDVAGEPLLQPVMRAGRRVAAGQITLLEARKHAQCELAQLPESLKSLSQAEPYPVEVSETLKRDLEVFRAELRTR